MTQFSSSLAAFAAGYISTSAAARLVTSLSALDWITVGRAGVDEPVSQITRNMVLDETDAGQATLFGTGSAPARAAALVNGTTSHALDYDDTHFAHIGHPSVAVFPAALAMGQVENKPLVDVLEAALVGMEISVRVGLWLGRNHYQTGFHQTATAGAFGAAAAAARLAGLNSEQIQMVLGLTATRAAGLKIQFGTMGKPYNAGLAASAGIEATELVRRGFVSQPEALEGAFGFGATHHGQQDVQAGLDGLGDEWLFESVSHKFHACCHGLHAALEAARTLDIAEPEVAEILVKTSPRWMSVCNQIAPTTGLGAKFSYRTVLAMRAIGYDTAKLESYSDDVCADPRLIRLRDRIKVEADESLSETEAKLTILRRDGARLEVYHDLQSPLSLSDREDRVRRKAKILIGHQMADEIWAILQRGGSAHGFAGYLTIAP
jgi:2-methylcitrate dehydratase PrpD